MSHRVSLVLLALALAITSAALLALPARHAPHAASPTSMDEAAMRRQIADYYAAHPAHGTATNVLAADTFTVTNFQFDTDGNAATQIDTARIQQHDAILFKWVAGFHTTTSGRPGDTDAGSHWNHAIDSNPGDLEVLVPFDTAGIFPFFCVPHGAAFNMKGVVFVSGPATGVTPIADAGTHAGFVVAPWPNPARAGVRFAFRATRSGRVRVDVFDAEGRRVANVVDRDLAAGAYQGRWDGRDAGGREARSGIYVMSLEAPGVRESRRVVVER